MNNILILFVFIILLIFIYYTYFKCSVSNNKKEIIEPFFTDDISINTNINNIYNKGFVNELMPQQNELITEEKKFNYFNNTINTKHQPNNIGDELISDYKSINDLNHFDDINNVFNNCKSKNNIMANLNKNFYDNHFTKKKSEDLPIANIHSSFLISKPIKLSENF